MIVGHNNNVSTYAQISFWGPEIVILACTIFTQFISEDITNFSDSSLSKNIGVPSIQSISSSVQSPKILHNPFKHETLT